MKMFYDEDWKQVCYDRKAEDYSSFLHRVTSLARDEFIQDLHIKELFIFPNKTEFYRHPLYIGGSIILQDKVSIKYFLKSVVDFLYILHRKFEKCIY
jgi:putative methyltransferase